MRQQSAANLKRIRENSTLSDTDSEVSSSDSSDKTSIFWAPKNSKNKQIVKQGVPRPVLIFPVVDEVATPSFGTITKLQPRLASSNTVVSTGVPIIIKAQFLRPRYRFGQPNANVTAALTLCISAWIKACIISHRNISPRKANYLFPIRAVPKTDGSLRPILDLSLIHI